MESPKPRSEIDRLADALDAIRAEHKLLSLSLRVDDGTDSDHRFVAVATDQLAAVGENGYAHGMMLMVEFDGCSTSVSEAIEEALEDVAIFRSNRLELSAGRY